MLSSRMENQLSHVDVKLQNEDTGDGSWGFDDQLYRPDFHPKHEKIHRIDWPQKLIPPFYIWRKSTDLDVAPVDEPIANTLEMIQAIIVGTRNIDSVLSKLCDEGATRMRELQQGRDAITLRTSHYEWLIDDGPEQPAYRDRVEAQRRLIGEWCDEAMPRFDEAMDECYEWVNGIYLATDTAAEAARDAWGFEYDDGWFGGGEWTADPIPTDEHIERLESSYENFVEAAYDGELRFVVNDLYEKLRTPKEMDEELGF